MDKHTPGPWKSLPEEADKPYIRIRGTALGRRYKIANVMDPCNSGVTDQDFDETRANARLIAAAPELLEALQTLCNSFQWFIDTHPASFDDEDKAELSAGYAAIAKATGEAP